MKRLLIYLFILFCPFAAFGQEFIWGVGLDTRFDNREYATMDTGISQTLFNSRLSPNLGVKFTESNSIVLGVDLRADFGDDSTLNPDVNFYYQYKKDAYAAMVGLVPRSKVIGEYSRAFFSDSLSYYDANISGLLMQYKNGSSYAELGFDWLGKEGESEREKFMIFSAGEYKYGCLVAGYNAMMFHHAGSKTVRGVVDNILLKPYIGLDLAGKAWFDKLHLKAGWLQAMQNDRKYVGEYVTPGGAEINLRLEKFKFGIDNTLYLGENLMPYYENYGAGLYFGDIFYSNHKLYNRLEIYWQPISNERMALKISSIHHFDGSNLGSQQLASFVVKIGKADFSNKKQKK